jgi:hypothetical protein
MTLAYNPQKLISLHHLTMTIIRSKHSAMFFLYYLHRAFFNKSQITHQRNALYFLSLFLFFNPFSHGVEE